MPSVIDMRTGIAIAGTILVDKINEISVYPNAGELTKIRSASLSVGGLVPNDGVDLKRIKPTIPVYAIGKVGADAEGAYVVETLQKNGVNTDGIIVDENGKTSFTEVMSVAGGQRTFFTYAGVCADFGFSDFDFDNINAKMLHLGYFLLLDKIDDGDGVQVLKEAKKRGIKTSIDLVSENSGRYSLVLPCLPYVDNLIINETEAGSLCQIPPTKENLLDVVKKLKEYGVRERVIVHTPEMGICYDGKNITILASYSLPTGYIKGTTGAGDAFCSGALMGIYEEKSDEEILRMATVSATCSLRTADATSGIETYEKMNEFCKQFKRKEVCL